MKTEMLSKFPRAGLIGDPTPIARLDRLSDHLGIDLWIKRDDLTQLGFGGNKIRQLDYYFGAALAQGADTILITGAVQSNYVRSAAAVAARLGMQSIVQLENRVPGKGAQYATSGNVLLDQILGAKIVTYENGEDEAGADQALRVHADKLRAEGRTPFVIPLGLNNPPTGALGYIDAAREILAQASDFNDVVVASGSGQTHSGLLFGLRAFGNRARVHGICVRRDAAQQATRIETILANIASLVGQQSPCETDDILVSDIALAPGYGQISDQTRRAIALLARQEGLFLDPVYTGKAFAGLLEHVASGQIEKGAKVLFVHTGGLPSLFAYGPEILASNSE